MSLMIRDFETTKAGKVCRMPNMSLRLYFQRFGLGKNGIIRLAKEEMFLV